MSPDLIPPLIGGIGVQKNSEILIIFQNFSNFFKFFQTCRLKNSKKNVYYQNEYILTGSMLKDDVKCFELKRKKVFVSVHPGLQ